MVIESVTKSASGGSSREFIWMNNPKQIGLAAETIFDSLKNATIIDEWVYLIRQARHPDFIWDIDYIQPTDELQKINLLIDQSEDVLFESKNSLKLKSNYTVDLNALAIFNIIRAYRKAEKLEYTDSLQIWNELYESDYFRLTPIRQSNLLMHMHIAFMCFKDFEKAFACYSKHLLFTKILPFKQQHTYGVLDNSSIMYFIQCFFARHVPEFLSFITNKLDALEREMLIHKKVEVLEFLPIQFYVQILSKTFYDLAKSTMPLPNYDLSTFIKNKHSPVERVETILEKQYIECLNSPYSSKSEINARKWDLLLSNQSESKSDQSKDLIDFLDDYGLHYDEVIDVGCGLSNIPKIYFENKNLVRVDASNFASNYWAAKDPIIEMSGEEYLKNSQEFDLCFCSNVLPAMPSPVEFLQQCHSKCKYLAASLAYASIGIVPSGSLTIEMWANNLSCDEWVKIIGKYFDIKHVNSIDGILYVIGQKRDNITQI